MTTLSTTNEIPTRAVLVRALKKGEATVKFKKADKSIRVMRCTLEDEAVPTIDGKVGGEDKETVTVYDLDKQGWRSFRLDSLRSVKVADGTLYKAAAKMRPLR